MLFIKQLTLLPINEKLRLRDMMFRKDINQTELNEINYKYDFTINFIDELDNYLPCTFYKYYKVIFIKRAPLNKNYKFLFNVVNILLKNITDNEVKLLHKIHTLDLTECNKIKDAEIISLVKINNEIVEERDSGNNAPNVEDSRRNESVKFLHKLYSLNLSNCYNITDARIISLVKRNNESVEERDSGNNAPEVSRRNESVKILGGLHTLELWDCPNITDKSVKMLDLVVAYAPSRQDLF